jgi:hypothetical protein
MDETIEQIEAHIDQTRQRLGSNLQELERKVHAATDWREQFRARPYLALGIAFAGGVAVATAARRRPTARSFNAPRDTTALAQTPNGSDVREQAIEVWNNVKRALIGVATARVKDYVGQLIPDFQEHFQHAEQRAATSRGRALGIDRA